MSELIEVCMNKEGRILWNKPYIFSRLEKIGANFIENSRKYEVLSSIQDGDLIITKVRELQ